MTKTQELHKMVSELVDDYCWDKECEVFSFATENNIEMGEKYNDEDTEMIGYWVEDDYYLFPEFR